MYPKIMLAVLVLGALVSACSPIASKALSESGTGNDPAVSPLTTGDTQSSDPGSVIDNSGTVSSSGSTGSEPGNVAGSMPDSQNQGSKNIMQWISYTDPTFGFSIDYPDIYTTLEEPTNLSEVQSGLIGRLRFLEPSLANSDVADLEPPKFSIEIYSNVEKLSLSNWIGANTPSGDIESVVIDNETCSKVTMTALLAPNQFIFCQHANNIYKFTPLGSQSQKMLDSFKFGK